MFSISPTLGNRTPSATFYREVGASTSLDGASPHKLVSLLYAALASQIARARGATVSQESEKSSLLIKRELDVGIGNRGTTHPYFGVIKILIDDGHRRSRST